MSVNDSFSLPSTIEDLLLAFWGKIVGYPYFGGVRWFSRRRTCKVVIVSSFSSFTVLIIFDNYCERRRVDGIEGRSFLRYDIQESRIVLRCIVLNLIIAQLWLEWRYRKVRAISF